MKNKKKYRVRGIVKIFPLVNPWIYVGVPKSHTKELSPLAQRGLIPITVAFGKSKWNTSLLPKGDGTHFIPLNAKVRKAGGVEIGRQITLSYTVRN